MVAPLAIFGAVEGAQLLFYLIIVLLFFVLLLTLCCCLYCYLRRNCCLRHNRSAADDEVDLVERPQIEERRDFLNVPRSIFSHFIKKHLTRAAAINAIQQRRESMLEEGISSDSEMERLYEQAVDKILTPEARAPDERSDVDLDLHRLRRRDAEQLVRRLLSRAHSRPVAHGVGTVHTFVDPNNNVQQPCRVLRIDAGRGTHSPNGVPVLQHAVRDLLDGGGVRYMTLPPPHEGTFLIDYRTASLDQPDMVLIDA